MQISGILQRRAAGGSSSNTQHFILHLLVVARKVPVTAVDDSGVISEARTPYRKVFQSLLIE
jgi:hypothetical protein